MQCEDYLDALPAWISRMSQQLLATAVRCFSVLGEEDAVMSNYLR